MTYCKDFPGLLSFHMKLRTYNIWLLSSLCRPEGLGEKVWYIFYHHLLPITHWAYFLVYLHALEFQGELPMKLLLSLFT